MSYDIFQISNMQYTQLPGYVRLIFGTEVHESDRQIREYKNYGQADLAKRNVALKALMFTNYKFTCVPQNLRYKSDTYRMHEPRPEQIKPVMPPRPNEASPDDDSMSRITLSSNGQYKIDILDSQYKDHLTKWVFLLAEQNEVNKLCTSAFLPSATVVAER